MGEGNSIGWHPSSKEITYGRYFTQYPFSLNIYEDFKVKDAYEPERKDYIVNTFDGAAVIANEIENPFFNEKRTIQFARFDHIEWSVDEKIMASISNAESGISDITLYDIAKGEELAIIKGEENPYLIKFSPNNNYLATASETGAIYIRNALTGADTSLVVEAGIPVIKMSWSPNSRYLVFVDEADQLIIWDQQEKLLKHKMQSPLGVSKMMFHPNHSESLLLLNEEEVLLLDFNQLEKGLRSLYADNDERNMNMEWANNNEQLLLSQENGQAVYFSYRNKQLMAKKNISFKEDLFSPISSKGSLLCTYSRLNEDAYEFKRDDREMVIIRDMNTLLPIGSINDTRNRLIIDMVLSPNDKLLATLGFKLSAEQGRYFRGQEVIDIWDVEKKKSLYELDVFNVDKIAFSPRGNYLIVYKQNGEVIFLPMNISDIQQFYAEGR